ncbi:hypothetical protein CPB84DRAFT_1727410 [Gymnopilus junonius]|uniref:HTH APSES-type domain-containing protein n=1 Tax=Gymnopilus junonius TaxID=109634 RepID=A0A9P5TR36_GYMJU|nr:hypothetical protein CPB84DRAFT_1727410 [Gymnopilus junonius]
MVARPPLPVRHANPNISEHLLAPSLPPVKYQILNCQGKDILVGRLKIETPTDTGHAFILRRFDTGAVSLTTMFRAAFPLASEHDEKLEIQWVKDNYDLTGNNGSSKDTQITRLAGTWVSPQLALELGKAYALGSIINAVVEAVPDPQASYRRSGKAAAAATAASVNSSSIVTTATTNGTGSVTTTSIGEHMSVVVSKPPSAAKSLPTPSPTSTAPPTKRRKESTPEPAPSSAKPPSRSSPGPAKTVPLRRSTRTKSPAPRSSAGSVAPLTTLRTPKATRSKAPLSTSSKTPAESDLASVDEESQSVQDNVADELHKEDIQEQKKLIQDLKAKREAALSTEENLVAESSFKKREREDEDKPLQFDFKEPETEERAIASNRRVTRFNLEPRTKSAAWGIAAFAFAVGAM